MKYKEKRKEKQMNLIDLVEEKQIKEDVGSFNVGDAVKVHVVIREGGKERIQVFRGDVISKKGSGPSATFTVRKMSLKLSERERSEELNCTIFGS
jgi:ribosomal protein L19